MASFKLQPLLLRFLSTAGTLLCHGHLPVLACSGGLANFQRLVNQLQMSRLLPSDCSHFTPPVTLSHVTQLCPIASIWSCNCSCYTPLGFGCYKTWQGVRVCWKAWKMPAPQESISQTSLRLTLSQISPEHTLIKLLSPSTFLS